MRIGYDVTSARPNPYAKRLRQSVTMRLEQPTIEHVKALAGETEIPYQTLINLYLRERTATTKAPGCPVAQGALRRGLTSPHELRGAVRVTRPGLAPVGRATAR